MYVVNKITLMYQYCGEPQYTVSLEKQRYRCPLMDYTFGPCPDTFTAHQLFCRL